MTAPWLIAVLLLWALVLLLGFLLFGTLRSLALISWRLDQLEATMPSRVGRSGLKPGQPAPDFTLPSVQNGDVSLHDFAARKVLLIFVQTGCGPCHDIVPQLNKLAARDGVLQVLVINHAAPEDARGWVEETGADFPVLIQADWSVSKRYEAFATPFAFLIDERGVIASKGIVSQRQHLHYLLSAAAGHHRAAAQDQHLDEASPLPSVLESAVLR